MAIATSTNQRTAKTTDSATIRRRFENPLPYEPVGFDASKKYRLREPSMYEDPVFTRRFRLFVGFMIMLILATVIGIAYMATQYTIKQYRLQQLEESMRNLEVQISHAQAENLGARRTVFFDMSVKSDLNIEYPQVMRFVHLNPMLENVDADKLIETTYGFCSSRIEFGGELLKF